MKKKLSFGVDCLLIAAAIFGCGRQENSATGEKKRKVRETVEDVVTQDFKIYGGAKKTLQKIDRDSQERKEEIEKELK